MKLLISLTRDLQVFVVKCTLSILKSNVTAPRLPMLSLARSLDLNLDDKVLIEDGTMLGISPSPIGIPTRIPHK